MSRTVITTRDKIPGIKFKDKLLDLIEDQTKRNQIALIQDDKFIKRYLDNLEESDCLKNFYINIRMIISPCPPSTWMKKLDEHTIKCVQ
jgi:hypothetical protein